VAYKIVVMPAAVHDIVAACNYYGTKNRHLIEKFQTEVDEVYIKLQEHPQFYSFIKAKNKTGFRDIKLPSFPYVVVFEISNSDVIVYAVKNTFLRPVRIVRKK
jgi:hypothetical protein